MTAVFVIKDTIDNSYVSSIGWTTEIQNAYLYLTYEEVEKDVEKYLVNFSYLQIIKIYIP